MVRAFVPGGAEHMVLHLCRYLWQQAEVQGIQCSLLILQPSKSTLAAQLPPDRVHHFAVWSPRFVQGLLQLRRWVRQHNPAVIHAHLPFCGILSSLLLPTRKLGISTLYTEHSVYRPRPDFWLHGWCYARHSLVHYVSAYVQQSMEAQRWGRFYHPVQAVLVPNAIPPVPCQRAVAPAAQKNTLTIGTLCVFRPVKNLPTMVRLMAALHRAFPGRLRFVLGGTGPHAGAVADAVAQAGMQGIIELPGMVEDVPAFLAGLDVFMLTSLYEGLPLALLEAMQQGCLPTLMRNGSTDDWPIEDFGLHFEPNEEAALCRYIATLLELPAAARAIRHRQSRNFVLARFDPQHHYNAIVQLYRRLLANTTYEEKLP